MIYKVVLNGASHGVSIQNVLYYRLGVGFDPSELGLGGGQQVCEAVRDTVWPALKAAHDTGYTLDSIQAYVFDDATFDLFYQEPYTLNIDEAGAITADTDGTAEVLIIKYQLEPTILVANGPKPPRRGYFAFGPVISGWVNNAGHYDNTTNGDNTNKMAAVATALAANLTTITPPASYWPIRVHQEKVLGIFKITSFTDISAATVRSLASWRRSRQPEI